MFRNLVDFHCHLDLYPDFHRIIEECEQAKIHTLTVTTTPKAWPRNRELCSTKKYVRCALGLHPQLVEERSSEIGLWSEYLHETRYVGEVGLDAGAQFSKSFDIQKEIFYRILKECSEAKGKILTVHSVRSAPVVLDMIEQSAVHKENKVVLHWFSGSVSNAKRALELGCFFSINSSMLKQSRSIDLVKTIPIERILTETDGPFTTYNGNPTKPINVLNTIDEFSKIIGISRDELSEMIFQNMLTLEA